jgi:beta-glucuronidase
MISSCKYTLLFLLLSIKLFSQDNQTAHWETSSLAPQQNLIRNVMNISGIWNFKVDSNQIGEQQQWYNGLSNTRPMAVPASWNDQYDELRDYLGHAWYEQNTYIPKNWQGQQILIRFGSANYAAKVWINGKYIGKHEGGHLPFSFDITSVVNWEATNKIVVQVENILKPSRVPTGAVTSEGGFVNFPATNYDFFPFCGLQRPVYIYAIPKNHIANITITGTVLKDKDALIAVKINKEGNLKNGKISFLGDGKIYEQDFIFNGNEATIKINIPAAHLWNTEDPYLYELNVSLYKDKEVVDQYSLATGIRTIEVSNNKILLNGKPIYLKGFGKHEDFPILGKGTSDPVIVKDYALLKWVGANSYRTSHYPYDEAYMNMADKLGILIIDEIPAVGLFFDNNLAQLKEREAMCKQQITELINRDKNHPSVIMWSVANEPGLRSSYLKKDTHDTVSNQFFTSLLQTAKKLDPTRLVTLVGAENEPYDWLGLADVVCINRYFGWYTQSGNIQQGANLLSKELDVIHEKTKKPIMITEFGADAYPGMHGTNVEMFTEEYQRDFIKSYLEVLDSKDFIFGAHVWAFADFKTSQGSNRFGGYNWKGVFTRDRKPKMAAYFLKTKWSGN